MVKYYKYRYYFNALHSEDGEKEHARMYTFTVTLYLKPMGKEQFVSFDEIDRIARENLKEYQGAYLNELPAFSTELPTIDKIGKYLNQQFRNAMRVKQFELVQLEISDTPLRSYLISNRLLVSTRNQKENEARYLRLLLKDTDKGMNEEHEK